MEHTEEEEEVNSISQSPEEEEKPSPADVYVHSCEAEAEAETLNKKLSNLEEKVKIEVHVLKIEEEEEEEEDDDDGVNDNGKKEDQVDDDDSGIKDEDQVNSNGNKEEEEEDQVNSNGNKEEEEEDQVNGEGDKEDPPGVNDVKGEDRVDDDDDKKGDKEDQVKDNGIKFEDQVINNWAEDERSLNDKEIQQENENKIGSENWGGETVAVKEDKFGRFQHYPLRPDEPDCAYYLRTGTCRYGSNCKFSHPSTRKNHVRPPLDFADPVQVVKDKDEYHDKTGQQECKYYLRTGGCKFGKACRYDHSREKSTNEPPVEFNFLGLPIRPGEKECPFYMRTGSCKFGTSCRFHHPDPTASGGSDPGYDKSGSVPFSSRESQPPVASWSLPRASNAAIPFVGTAPTYVPMMIPPPQGMHSSLEWNGYQASPAVSPLYSPKANVRPPMSLIFNDSTRNSDGYTPHLQHMPVDAFPERPGQKECQYFMKTGDCKYRSACRFHHPKNRMSKAPVLSPLGLPMRPDQIICTHYSRYGICKFGPACKYDHPPNYGTSAFPVGSMTGPTAPFDNAALGTSRIADSGDGRKTLVQQSV